MKIAVSLALLLVAAPALAQERYDPSLDSKRYDGCVRALEADARKVEDFATQWQALGGGLPARHCLALAQLKLGKNAAAASTLAAAALAAETAKSPFAADFWGQAGNAAMLAGDMKGAIAHFDAGLKAAGGPAPDATASLLIDRARARVEMAELAAARVDLDRALKLDDNDAEAWLLSAALARREKRIDRARADIARAATLSPTDADIAFEQGNIEAADGKPEAARGYWQRAVDTAPAEQAGKFAAKALADNPR